MGYGPYLSRRELFGAIPVLCSGSLLEPVRGQPSQRPAGVVRGALADASSGAPVAAKLRVVNADTGEVLFPAACIKSMPRKPEQVRYFYARGKYEIGLPAGRYRIEAVRGIEYAPATVELQVGGGATRTQDFKLSRIQDLHAAGWYSGNTHTHYNVDIEEPVDDRLRMVPPAESLDVSVISYLIREKLPYASNRIPIGRLPQFSRDGTILDMGEECRNNTPTNAFGYGHCLFLNIPRLVEPVSTGFLSPDGDAPDFPTLSMLCEEARRLGGVTIWCHNGGGMEAPVTVALGHMDAVNVNDGSMRDYDWYYRVLNCGIRLPLSSGTDWWEYDHNRVFVRLKGALSYDAWLEGLRAGRTFVSNGPLFEFEVQGQGPGATVTGKRVRIKARALSRVPFERLEIVHDGEVIAAQPAADGLEARIEREIGVTNDGWVAARVGGSAKTARGYDLYGHTGPVWLKAGRPPRRRAESAAWFVSDIQRSMEFIRKSYRFAKEADMALALGRFEQGRRFYARLAAA